MYELNQVAILHHLLGGKYPSLFAYYMREEVLTFFTGFCTDFVEYSERFCVLYLLSFSSIIRLRFLMSFFNLYFLQNTELKSAATITTNVTENIIATIQPHEPGLSG